VNLLQQISTLVRIEFIRPNKPVECGAEVRTRLPVEVILRLAHGQIVVRYGTALQFFHDGGHLTAFKTAISAFIRSRSANSKIAKKPTNNPNPTINRRAVLLPK